MIPKATTPFFPNDLDSPILAYIQSSHSFFPQLTLSGSHSSLSTRRTKFVLIFKFWLIRCAWPN